MAGPPVAYPQRLTAFVLYGGLAPFFMRSERVNRNPFLRHHRDHALAVLALLLGVLLLFVLVVMALSYAMIWHRNTYESLVLEPRLLDLSWKCFLAWLVFWAFAAAHPLFGSTHAIPVVTNLSKRLWLRRITAVMWVGLLSLTLVLAAIAGRGASLLRHDDAPGTVYLLYEDLDSVPRLVFALGFYRLAAATEACYGPGEAVYLELTKENIRRALEEGAFIFIGSHGKAKGLITETGWFRPEDIEQGVISPNLRYVYLTGCDSGAQATAWKEALRPAQVVTHDRLTTVVEHVWWLWGAGPATVCNQARN